MISNKLITLFELQVKQPSPASPGNKVVDLFENKQTNKQTTRTTVQLNGF